MIVKGKKTALVTGGAGFIGSNLVKKLVKDGWIVDVVDDMSNGHLNLLDGLNLRHLPNASFLKHYNTQIKTRSQAEVIFIEDDFASLGILQNICEKKYHVVFHQAKYSRNKLVGFVKTENSWHSVDEIDLSTNDERQTLNIFVRIKKK